MTEPMTKPRIPVFSGPTAAIANSPARITSNTLPPAWTAPPDPAVG